MVGGAPLQVSVTHAPHVLLLAALADAAAVVGHGRRLRHSQDCHRCGAQNEPAAVDARSRHGLLLWVTADGASPLCPQRFDTRDLRRVMRSGDELMSAGNMWTAREATALPACGTRVWAKERRRDAPDRRDCASTYRAQ